MIDREPTPELPATPEQAQSLVDEVARITANVEPSPGLEGIKNHSAPSKIRWHNKVLFIFNPDGQNNVDDPDVINLAGVAWDNPDGTRSSYATELGMDGLQLTKHVYPPSDGKLEARSRDTQDAMNKRDYGRAAFNASADLASATSDRDARMQERSLGLHIATANEAEELLTKLRQMESAPEKQYPY